MRWVINIFILIIVIFFYLGLSNFLIEPFNNYAGIISVSVWMLLGFSASIFYFKDKSSGDKKMTYEEYLNSIQREKWPVAAGLLGIILVAMLFHYIVF
tara:strand:+ start:129 stop:422 length:294 start_codon:yes stop_codon:yes gene_type:complete